jgi:hypothetical protein
MVDIILQLQVKILTLIVQLSSLIKYNVLNNHIPQHKSYVLSDKDYQYLHKLVSLLIMVLFKLSIKNNSSML